MRNDLEDSLIQVSGFVARCLNIASPTTGADGMTIQPFFRQGNR